MKQSKFVLIIAVAVSLFTACKKEATQKDPVYEEGFTRVGAIQGSDTSLTPYMHARTESVVLAMDQDTKLKAELIGFQHLSGGMASYTIRVINLTTCQDIIRWHWEGLTIDNITPPSDVVHAGDTVIFTLTGDALPGRITLSSQAVGSCGNSKTLIIDITTTILPIKYTAHKTHREGNNMIVEFTTEEPQNVDRFIVLWSPDGKGNEVVKCSTKSDGITKKYVMSFPAMRIAN